MALQGLLDIDGVKIFPQDEKWERSKECILKLNTHLTLTYTQKGGFLNQTLAFPTLLQFASYLDWDHGSLYHVPEASNGGIHILCKKTGGKG